MRKKCGALLFASLFGSIGFAANSVEQGRENWFNKSYNGYKFFQFLENHPDPSKRITVGFDNVIRTPRNLRFQTWGTINDPDCEADPGGGPDICKDPEATGVIGIRKTLDANGKPLYGITCASCHAGFDPIRPPKNLNEPRWNNIHPSIGNQFLDSGKIFSANLASADPRRLMFAAWPKGTVDTTLLFNDNIMNSGTITAFWNVPHRPLFDVGLDSPKMRAGQGGEDDLGGDIAALRVYTNIGVCFQECVASRPGQPIDIQQCRQACADFPPENDIANLVEFMRSLKSPKYPINSDFNPKRFLIGRKVFEKNCSSCHGENRRILSKDEVNPLVADTANATNKCRALTSNWESGKIWSQFSSEVYKDRVTAGNRGYRTMPLAGIWSTAPFLHNQSVGSWAAADASVKERGRVFEQSMYELLSAERTPKINVTPVAVGSFPAGTPLTIIFSRDPSTGAVLCDDAVENRGHHYGANLSDYEKKTLVHWLKYQ